MSVTKRATRNRVDPLPVRANHFFEKLESGVKRFGRGCVGVSYIALGAAIAGGMAYANSFPLSQLRDHELIGVGAGTVAASILALLYGFKIARRPRRRLEKFLAVAGPSGLLAATSYLLVKDLIESSGLFSDPAVSTQFLI
jgi:hypothetical protein